MNELSGKEERSDGGCLFGTGVLLVLTIASLSPILFPDILTSMWYTPLYLSTGGFLLTGFILFLIPLSDRRTKYLLLFILSSCILLLVFIFQFSISQTDDTVVKPAAWSIWLYMGYAVFLIGLFIFTLIANVRRQDKTAQNITASSLSISESRVTIGEVFLIHYLLACKEMTPIKSVSITFVYQQYSAFLSTQPDIRVMMNALFPSLKRGMW